MAPLALLDLLPEENRPDRVLALCTPEAKEGSWLLLKEALGDSCEVVDVPTGLTNQDVQGFLDVLVDAIFKEGEKVELIVDITHGFRHFSFLVYSAALYLSSFKGITVRNVFYGLLQREGASPFLDLKPLLLLPLWSYAVKVFRETGSARQMAAMLEEIENQYEALRADRAGEVLERYRRACQTIGSQIRVAQGESLIEGTAVAVNEAGELVIKPADDKRLVCVNAGEVTLVKG